MTLFCCFVACPRTRLLENSFVLSSSTPFETAALHQPRDEPIVVRKELNTFQLEMFLEPGNADVAFSSVCEWNGKQRLQDNTKHETTTTIQSPRFRGVGVVGNSDSLV